MTVGLAIVIWQVALEVFAWQSGLWLKPKLSQKFAYMQMTNR